MGLRMDDLHAPTIDAGPVTSSQAGVDSSRKSLLELCDERDRVQGELTALSSVLQFHRADMQTPLLTSDGFPRPDIDVAQVRVTRARIVRLKNDYKWIMERIEKGLQKHHENLHCTTPDAVLPSISSSYETKGTDLSGLGSASQDPPNSLQIPFARVGGIVESSPAQTAGLMVGDKITKFGNVDWTNHEKLSRLSQSVRANEGRELVVSVWRVSHGASSEAFELKLTPQHNWGGSGLLGCHILPME